MADDDEAKIVLLMYQRRESTKARLMSPNSHRKHKVWLPKSQIRTVMTIERDVYLTFMPEWLAERAELLQFLPVEEKVERSELWTGARKLDLD